MNLIYMTQHYILAVSKDMMHLGYNHDHVLSIMFLKYVGLISFKIECHAVGDTWWQPLLSYGKRVENSRLVHSFINIKHCI